MGRKLQLTRFRDVDLNDPFFDSLKAGYAGFPAWFSSKANEELYIVNDDGRVSGMIYLKSEIGAVTDVDPALPDRKWMKVGTLKIEGRGTKLGERVLKKIFDTALDRGMDGVYVTVFELHKELIALFEKYGFVRHATKTTSDGTELVLVREFDVRTDDLIADYPFICTAGKRAWLLAVYPEYHSQLLPDSILKNESQEIVRDVSHTNTIHKMYIGGVPLTRMTRGDAVIIYRTTDNKGPAYFRSVVTSVGIIEEVKKKADFASADAFVAYTKPHSVFSEQELRDKFAVKTKLYVAKFTYNAAFNKRTTRGRLLDEVGITENPRWDFRELSQSQFKNILILGEVNERLVVN